MNKRDLPWHRIQILRNVVQANSRTIVNERPQPSTDIQHDLADAPLVRLVQAPAHPEQLDGEDGDLLEGLDAPQRLVEVGDLDDLADGPHHHRGLRAAFGPRAPLACPAVEHPAQSGQEQGLRVGREVVVVDSEILDEIAYVCRAGAQYSVSDLVCVWCAWLRPFLLFIFFYSFASRVTLSGFENNP